LNISSKSILRPAQHHCIVPLATVGSSPLLKDNATSEVLDQAVVFLTVFVMYRSNNIGKSPVPFYTVFHRIILADSIGICVYKSIPNLLCLFLVY
jgi:hypothetical protein